ncbi:WD40 repeat domain-containing protein [Peristeroidobacter soli]|uniref:WD40 repeat domain-containing protein n=1 Tax=Peristeroidobacter soli TaxID=2497877 RepID=UPI00101D7E7E|nr:WD40 repeat domain-containing protein [Peristeroidobacter soli]
MIAIVSFAASALFVSLFDSRASAWSAEAVDVSFDLYVQAGHSADVIQTIFSEDSSVMASADEGGAIHLWDVAYASEYGAVSSGEQISALAVSVRNHLLLAGTRRGEVVFWELRRQNERERFSVRGGEVRSLHLNSDHSRLMVVAERRFTLWSLAEHRELSSQEIPQWQASALSPDGTRLALTTPDGLLMVDVSGRQPTIAVQRFGDPDDKQPLGVAWQADGQVAYEQYPGSFDVSAEIRADAVRWRNNSCRIPMLTALRPEDIRKDPLGFAQYRINPRRYFATADGVVAVAQVVIYGPDARVVAYNVSTCRLIRELQADHRGWNPKPDIGSVSVSPDGKWLAYGMGRDVFMSAAPTKAARSPIELSGVNVGRLTASSRPALDAMFLAGNRLVVNNGAGNVSTFDLRSDQPLSSFARTMDVDGEQSGVTRLRKSASDPAGAELVIFGEEGEANLIRSVFEGFHDDFAIERRALPSGAKLSRCSLNGRPVLGLRSHAFSENARAIVIAGGRMGADDAVAVFSVDACKKLWTLDKETHPAALAISDDGNFLLRHYGGDRVEYLVRPKRKGTVPPPTGAGTVRAIAVAGDGTAFAVGYGDGRVDLWNVGKKEITRAETLRIGGATLTYLQFLGSRRLAASTDGGELRLWNRDDPDASLSYVRAPGAVARVAEQNDMSLVVGVTSRNAVALWRAASDRPTASPPLLVLKQLARSGWIVASPSGAFDTDNVDQTLGLSFRHPLRDGVLPIEAFYRDGYSPGVGPRLLAGEGMSSEPLPSNLNLVQPTVKILSAEPSPDDASSMLVMVEVSGARRDVSIGDRHETHATDVYDVRLFRDGQLIEQLPADVEDAPPANETSQQALSRWQRTHKVVALSDGPRQLPFKVRVPMDAKRVVFSAYAFNVNRIKSQAATLQVDLPNRPKIPRRAYLLTVGVNAFSDAAWNLSYAMNDAVESGTMLQAGLRTVVDEVVWVSLLSHAALPSGQPAVMQASREHIRAAIRALAGDREQMAALAGVANADQLRRANPDDMVFIIVSTHGLVDAAGQFYLLPANIDHGLQPPALFERAISSDQLAGWLRGVDARDLVMIVDACHAEAGLQHGGFKPAPLGNRGLGQLAYDKRMRILVGSRKDQYARETSRTRLGLLMYALLNDGLQEFRADVSRDNKIMLTEWMNYAVTRVPELYLELAAGQFQIKGGNYVPAADGEAGLQQRVLQQPVLFDFGSGRDIQIKQRQ